MNTALTIRQASEPLNEEDFIDDLNEQLQQACFLLKKNKSAWPLSKSHLYKRPWLLVIGPSQTGKTSLLKEADIKWVYPILGKKLGAHIAISEQAVFIKTPGQLISGENKTTLCQRVVKTVKKYRRRQAFDGVVITLSMKDVARKNFSRSHQLIKKIRHALEQFSHVLSSRIPLYIVLTHCDLMTGFQEFLSELTYQQRQRCLGMVFLKQKQQISLAGQLDTEFKQLLHRLQQQLINRLHSIRDQQKRWLAQEFPLQIESIYQQLCYITQQLTQSKVINTHYHIKGIFFTSSVQQGQHIDCLEKSTAKETALKLQDFPPVELKSKPYFTHEILNNIIPNRKFIQNVQSTHKQFTLKTFTYGKLSGAFITVGFLGAICLTQFVHSLTSLITANQLLQQFQLAKHGEFSTDPLSKKLNNLIILQKAQQKLTHLDRFWIKRQNIQNIRESINAIHQQQLESQLFPAIRKRIEHYLSLENERSAENIFFALKTYLMLGQEKYRNNQYISNWLYQFALSERPSEQYGEIDIEQLSNILASKKPISIPLDLSIIERARNYLESLPQEHLIYLSIKTHWRNNKQETDSKNKLLVPKIYTKQGFQQIANQIINSNPVQLLQDEWVLPKSNYSKDNFEKNELLKRRILSHYVADYVAWWKACFTKIAKIEWHNPQQAYQTLTQLSSNKSKLLQLITALQDNTAPMIGQDLAISELFNNEITRNFLDANQLTNVDKKQLQRLLKQLTNLFQQISHSYQGPFMAFNMSKQRFETTGQSNNILSELIDFSQLQARPMQEWLNTIIQNSWRIILEQTKLHINHEWTYRIYPTYQRVISQRFPLAKHASAEIDMADFKNFFSETGELKRFFNHYLRPFLNIEQSEWQPKYLDSISLAIPKETIHQFQRANIINKMFFNEKTNQLAVDFSLTAMDMNEIVKNINLDINGQKIYDYQGSNKHSTIHWPGDLYKQFSSLTVETTDGEQISSVEHGAWAWFKLLSKANLKMTNANDTTHFIITFSQNQLPVIQYSLVANNALNPFIPNVIEHFKLPKTIV